MQGRAYAVLTLKAVDEEQRILEGVATTLDVDRVGDIVEPKGAEFNLPIPFLFQHNSREPIGEVFFAKVTSDGIQIKARIAKIDEPGKLKDRIDEAWQSIKHRLVRGLSIGFQSIEHSHIDGTFGIKFSKWLWLELSAVTIPANSAASITAIKSAFDASRLAAIGNSGGSHALGDSSTSNTRRSKDASRMNLTQVKTAIGDKKSRLEELMKLAELDEDQQTEIGALPGEIKSLTTKANQLQAIEDANLTLASPVGVVKDINGASAARAASSHQAIVTPNRPKEMGFVRAVICKAAAFLNPGMSALEIAKAAYPDDSPVHAYLKAAVAAGVTTDAGWAGNLVYPTNVVSEFIEYLRPRTILGQFGQGNIPSLRNVPFNSRGVSLTSGATGYWVGQGLLKPVTRLTTGTWSLAFAKAAALAVISRELAKFSVPSAESLVRDELIKAGRAILDTTFIRPDVAPVANVSPGSILNGITPIPSSGTDANAVRADVAAILAPFIAANIDPTTGVWIMSTTLALQLALMRNPLGQKEFPDITMRGGSFEGFPVIASEYATDGSPGTNLLAFVNASDIFLADDGEFDVMVSDQASIKMASDPNGADSSAAYVSMFQSNQLALLVERYINWDRRRDEAVQFIQAAEYSSGSPA